VLPARKALPGAEEPARSARTAEKDQASEQAA
jgi:hypothetical protein